ncbi:MAG: site-specific integrase [Sphaerochaetaceae bacterium]|nr:site-specific integrase [Sphaerochaetaceae bacterium]
MERIRIKNESKKGFDSAFNEFINEKSIEGLSEKTLEKYSICWNEFVGSISADSTDVISNTSVNEYIAYLKAFTGACDITRRVRIQQVRVAIYWFQNRGYTPRFKIKLPKAVTKVKDIYTEEELKRLLVKPNLHKCDFSEYRNWVVVNFLIGTGCRANTLVNIKVKDVDLVNAQVRYTTTKNKRQQIVPLPLSLVKVLNTYLVKTRLNQNDDNYVFPNSYGNQWNSNSLSNRLREYNRRHGVNKTGVHLFRHTFASYWIKTGGDPFRLQKILGHSSLKMVQNYVRMYSDDISEAYLKSNPLESLSKSNKYIYLRGVNNG